MLVKAWKSRSASPRSVCSRGEMGDSPQVAQKRVVTSFPQVGHVHAQGLEVLFMSRVFTQA